MRPIGLALAALATVMGPLAAQTLPPPAQTIYRCEVGGKVHYSDTPCLGAQKVDATPTRGVNTSTGQKRVGDDVRRELHDEQMAEVFKPLLNETVDQRTTRLRRVRLSAEARSECARLDGRIAQFEAQEQAAQGERQAVQRQLLAARQRHRALRC